MPGTLRASRCFGVTCNSTLKQLAPVLMAAYSMSFQYVTAICTGLSCIGTDHVAMARLTLHALEICQETELLHGQICQLC